MLFNFKVFWEKINDEILNKIWKTSKNLIFHHVFPFSQTPRIFIENPAVSVFLLSDPLTSCKKSAKTIEPILRKSVYGPSRMLTIFSAYNSTLWRIVESPRVIWFFWNISRTTFAINFKFGIQLPCNKAHLITHPEMIYWEHLINYSWFLSDFTCILGMFRSITPVGLFLCDT